MSPLLEFTMKRIVIVLMLIGLILTPVMAKGAAETGKDVVDGVYPKGEIMIWSTGQPQFRQTYYQAWLERNRDIAPEVNMAYEVLPTQSEGQQKVAMYALSGDKSSLPEMIMLDAVGVVNLASSGYLHDVTDYYNSVKDEFIEGAAADATLNGRVWGLPDSVRPQLIYYNTKVFEKYGIDPAMMDTFDGYLEVGRMLKERSNGEVYLSFIDPFARAWVVWGRRGLMPQANARIWDAEGNIVIGSDPGTKLALGYLDTLHSEKLLYKSEMYSQPLYEATDDGKIATFYQGAFWDEFMRKNLSATVGDWRVMPAPMFPEIGTRGAPVSSSFCFMDTGTNEYKQLCFDLWYDFQTNLVERNAWAAEMERIDGPYNNPVAIELLKDPFWQAPTDFYGGQSFTKAESDGLLNPSKNMMVTASDAEADVIISKELERYIAGEQTMNQAIANMDKELKLRIKKAKMP